MGKLFGDSRFTEAVLEFLAETDVGKIKKGVIVRGEVAEYPIIQRIRDLRIFIP